MRSLAIGGPSHVPNEPVIIRVPAPDSSTVGGAVGDCGEDFEQIVDFKTGIDKIRFVFPTNGLVDDDVQNGIDAALAGALRLIPSSTNGKGSPFSDIEKAYEIATNVPGVEEGHVFRIKSMGREFLGVENCDRTMIGFIGSAPIPQDIEFA
jgi:hypothetical protein